MQTDKQNISIGKDYFCRETTNQLNGYLVLGALIHYIYMNAQIHSHDKALGFVTIV